jgi:cell shape-determining protein MreD
MGILQGARRAAFEAANLSSDALHISVGLGVMLLVAVILRKSLRDWQPLAAVLLAALAGEIWALIDGFAHGGSPKWGVNWKDVVTTMFWPAVLFGLARFTRVLKR